MAIGGEGQDVITAISLQDQIAEVKREIKMRRNVYAEMIVEESDFAGRRGGPH